MRFSIEKKFNCITLNVGLFTKYLRLNVNVFVLLLIFFSHNLIAQTSVQNFGSGTSSLTSQTGNTTTIPNPTSGTSWARGGATAPAAQVNILNNTNPLGSTGSYVNAVASNTTSPSLNPSSASVMLSLTSRCNISSSNVLISLALSLILKVFSP